MLMKLKNFYLIAALMAAPMASFATDYFVTPDGRGTGDGLSWDNAMSINKMYEDVNGFENGDVFYFAGGTYYIPKIIGITKGYTFIGGFDPDLTGTEHTTPTYPSANPTTFSGDINDNGHDEGDLQQILIFGSTKGPYTEKVVLTGLEFTGAYSTTPKLENQGALRVRNCDDVEVNNCIFYDNVSAHKDSDADPVYGGMAFTGQFSTVRFNNCEFRNNKAHTRGGAIRVSSNAGSRGITVFNRCLIANNSDDEGIGSAICVQHGRSLYLINSTVVDNVSGQKGAAIYSGGADDTYQRNVYIVNSTIAGNEDGPQVEMTKNKLGANLYVANSIVVSDGDTPAFNIEGVNTFETGGMNVVGSDANGVLTWNNTTGTDDAKAENNYAAIFGDNVLGANGVIEPLADEGKYTVSALTAAVEDWGIEADLTEDQTGAKRAEGSTPGAYAKSTATGITGVEAVKGGADDAYYTLQGVKLGSRPTATGIYIHNGKKVIIR